MRYLIPFILLTGCAAERPAKPETGAPRFSIPDATSQPASKPVIRDITLDTLRRGLPEVMCSA